VYIIVYDFGSSNVKTCLFGIDQEIRLVTSAVGEYGLYTSDDGSSEQDAEEWWAALCSTTHEVLAKSHVKPEEVEGIAFCAQMQGTVLVDQNGNVLRRPMNYLDHKGVKEYEKCMGSGLIKVSGCNLFKLLRNLRVNYAASTSAKDTIWKYKWVENNEPDIFRKVYKWLDICDYLVMRCTGSMTRSADSAFATFLYDTRKGKEGWNKGLVKMYGIKPEHLPEIRECTDMAGKLTKKASEDLGLAEGIPVFGAGDTTFFNLGAGCTRPGETYIYIGTSGWVSTCMDHQAVDIDAMMTGILSAQKGCFNYFAPLETGGKCYEWAMDHLVLDELGIYADQTKITDKESKYQSPYEFLSEEVCKSPAGANGVIFTPWIHGNRCPFEDAHAGGMFFNVRIENDKRDMIRAVLEGVCYHLKWLLDCEEKKVKTSDPIRFVGGGALAPVTCQMLADITGRKVETVNNAQEVGATGTALVVAAGLQGTDVAELARRYVKVEHTYVPNPANKEVYKRSYGVFKKLYKCNAENFRALNRER